MKLIIQIPCYNEEQFIETTISDLPVFLDGIDLIEYLIIDDGSIDHTVSAAKKAGVHHIISLKKNSGLAIAFMAGIDACLQLGADIIVNTDADNQYCADDIEKLIKPILENKADMVIGTRPVEKTMHFSWLKKKLQHLGSKVVRVASKTNVLDAPSGFRAFTREAALRLNVYSEYTYTLETIIQAGNSNITVLSVPIKTNPPTRKSRLFKNIWQYVRRSALTIIRAFMMYKPLVFFATTGFVFFLSGFLLGLRYVFFILFRETPGAHIQSLILSIALMIIGVQTIIMALMADLISVNRKLLEDIRYRIKKFMTGSNKYE